MKIFKYITMASLLFALDSFASAKNDYNSGAYRDEGNILVKFRGSFLYTKGTNKGLPAARNPNPVKQGHMLNNGFGIENANTVFFTDHIAAELALGLHFYNTSRTSLKAISTNYGNGADAGKKRYLVGLPLSFTMQFHLAPFGAIRPYIGGGYSGTYFFSRAKEYKVGMGHGAVFQAGMDIVMTDDNLITVDIKKYSLAPKITYKSSFLGAGYNAFSSKLKIDPWIFSVGIGFKL